MYTMCWSVKGGSGTSVVAAALALRGSGLLVDFGGDAAAVLGIPEPEGPGVTDWLAADSDVGADSLDRLLTYAGFDTVEVLPKGHGRPRDDRWAALGGWLSERSARSPVVVDAGSDAEACAQLAPFALHSLLVTRSCYLALRRAAQSPLRPTGVVLIKEPKRALTSADVERIVGAPIVAVVPFDPQIASSVDSGLLSARPPQTLVRALRHAA